MDSEIQIKSELEEVESEIEILNVEENSGKKKRCLMKKACKSDCRYKCHKEINETQRQKIFDEFWKRTTNHSQKWQFIARHTNVLDIVKNTTAWKSRRTKSRQYFLTVDKKKIRVCKTMFLNTLGVGEASVETALRKGSEGGQLTEDMRGKHSKRLNKLSEDIINGIREHINMFPRMKINDGERNQEFLEEGLSVTKMYTFYKELLGKQMTPNICSERQYRDLFNSEFKLNFLKWKKDQCDFCTEWILMEPEEKDKLEEVYNTHVVNKDFVRDLKDQDKLNLAKDKTICIACFDMQKVFNVPKGETSIFYYKRSLFLYNFIVFDCVQYQGYSYVWSEDVAKDGSNEVASCLLKFVEKKAKEGTTELRLYSDNYNCRNSNPNMFSMLLLASAKYQVKIILRFFENGHFQHEGDVMRVQIEKKSKGQNIYAPEEWYEFIKHARDGVKAYQVRQMTQDDIYDINSLVSCQDWTTDIAKNISWSSVREVQVDHKFPDILSLKYVFQNEPDRISITNNRKDVDLKSFVLSKAYNSKRQIEKSKLQDLLSLCENNTIPTRYHSFYQSLITENVDHIEDEIMQQ